MRLFVALVVPPDVVGELLRWREAVCGSRPALADALRPVSEESLHLTLCFLGARPRDEVVPIGAALGSLTGAGAAPLALGGPWWLPRRRPTVLAVGVDDDDGVLREHQGVLVSRLRAAVGFVPERRMFIPHITIARVRPRAKVRPGTQLSAPVPVEFQGSRVVLLESVLGDGPAVYRALCGVDLRG